MSRAYIGGIGVLLQRGQGNIGRHKSPNSAKGLRDMVEYGKSFEFLGKTQLFFH